MDDREIERAEQYYRERYESASRDDKHTYYARIGSVAGIIFIIISGIFSGEFYKLFGTIGMTLLNGVAGICIFIAGISLLPGYKRDNKMKWDIIDRERKELDKLRKAKKK